jgi:hypothetical protein
MSLTHFRSPQAILRRCAVHRGCVLHAVVAVRNAVGQAPLSSVWIGWSHLRSVLGVQENVFPSPTVSPRLVGLTQGTLCAQQRRVVSMRLTAKL